MTRTDTQPDETVVSHKDVVVKRELTARDGGIVATLRLRSADETPVLVHVTDEFPASLPIEAAGFNSGKAPKSGDVTPQRASIKQPLEDEPVEIEYGISLSEPVEEVQIDPPTIREVAPGLTRSASRHTGAGGRSSPSGDVSSGSSKSFSSMIPSLGIGSSKTDHSDGPESSAGPSETTSGSGAPDRVDSLGE